jgi:hypothetical protein
LGDRFDAMAEANIEIDFMRDFARQLPAFVIADMLAIDPSYQSDVVVELHGQRMKKGRRVIALIGAANRDPAKFTDSARLDLARNQGNHLSFGYGPHVCIGAQLNAVLTPAFGGAYVLLGLARFAASLFEGSARSSASVAGETLRRLGWSVQCQPMLHDINEAHDLQWLPAGWLPKAGLPTGHCGPAHSLTLEQKNAR